jgi:large subunit ribosomal protein L10e
VGLRPGRTVRTPRRAWTRTAKRVVRKAFVRGVPDSKIRRFTMGKGKPDGFDIAYELVSQEACQIRDNALESARVMANKWFDKKITAENYYFKVHVYPHQCIRENAMISGAGADRLSSGMRKSFGKPKGRAARVKKNQTIMSVKTQKKFEKHAHTGLKRAASKLPGVYKIREKKLKPKAAT